MIWFKQDLIRISWIQWLDGNLSTLVLLIHRLHLKGGKAAASWLVYGTFNAAAAVHSDAEWSSGWPEEGRFSRKTTSHLYSNRIFLNPPTPPTPPIDACWGIFLSFIAFSLESAVLDADWADCGNQSVLSDRSSAAASHRVKCVTAIQLSHLQLSALHARTVPRADCFIR